MYNVSLVQPNFQSGPKHLNSFYLPYSVGALWSYVQLNQQIKENFALGNITFRREPIDTVIKNHAGIDIVLLSVYVWNIKYSLKLAKALKQSYPNIKIILGGPETPWRDPALFEKYPFIDSIVIGEGELAVEKILLDFINGKQLDKKYEFERIKDLDLPSPYLDGLFDKLIAEYPNIEWVPTIETDRGCPYGCTFCDWGSATASKMYKLYFDRINAEIEWVAKNKLPFISLTSSNFGIFKDRDPQIAQIIVDCKSKHGYPNGISVSYAKNSNKTVVDIVKMFADADIQSGITLSLQTTSSDVLANIDRRNMKINTIDEVVKLAQDNRLPISTELILGMPGETKLSWKNTLNDVMKNGITNYDIYYLQLIINSPMYVKQVVEYDLKTFKAYDFFYGVHTKTFKQDIEDGLAESVEVIESTKSLPREDLVEASILSWFIIGFHMYGITNLISKYFYDNKNIEYIDFYNDLFEALKDDKHLSLWIEQIELSLEQWKVKGYMGVTLGNYPLEGWQMFQSLMPAIQTGNLVEYFVNLVATFLKDKVDSDIISDYKTLTNLQIKQFGKYLDAPVIVDLKSNAFGNKVAVVDRHPEATTSLEEHLDLLYYHRRKSWHLNKILDK